MNTYGTVLEEMDLGLSIAEFQRQVLLPLSRLLFPGLMLWALVASGLCKNLAAPEG